MGPLPTDRDPNPLPTCHPQVGAVVIDIMIADVSRAGTDSNLRFSICPRRGSILCVTRRLVTDGPVFERDTINRITMVFSPTDRILMRDLLTNHEIFLRNNGGGDRPSFLLDTIKIYALPYFRLPAAQQNLPQTDRATAQLVATLGDRLPFTGGGWENVLSETFDECTQWIDEGESISFGVNPIYQCN